MKVGYFQTQPEFGEVDRNLEQVASRLGSVECELLVLPEFAFTGYQFVDQKEVLELSERVPGGPHDPSLSGTGPPTSDVFGRGVA